MIRQQGPFDRAPDDSLGSLSFYSPAESAAQGPPFSVSSPSLQQQQQQQGQIEEMVDDDFNEEAEEADQGLQHQHESFVSGGSPPGMPCPLLPLPHPPAPLPYDSIWRLLFLTLIAVSPFLAMILFVAYLKNVWAAMIVMHWICMVAVPTVYIHFSVDGWSYYKHVCRSQGPRGGRWKRQAPWALLGFVVGTVVVYGGARIIYLVLKIRWDIDLQEDIRLRALAHGMDVSFWPCLLFGIYFLVINPIIEELFWRVFLYRELGAGLFGSAQAGVLHIQEAQPLTHKFHRAWKVIAWNRRPHLRHIRSRQEALAQSRYPKDSEHRHTDAEEGLDTYVAAASPPDPQSIESPIPRAAATEAAEAADIATRVEAGEAGTAGDNTRNIAYYDLRVPVVGLLVLAADYASYHMVIFHRLMGGVYVLPSFILISFLGCICLYLRNKDRFGLLTATALHAGVDLGVVLVLGNALAFL